MNSQNLEIEPIVFDSCSELINRYEFKIKRESYHTVFLISESCGIRIVAGTSTIGEYQIEFSFFDPRIEIKKRKYYSNTSLLYNSIRKEPIIEIIDKNEDAVFSSFENLLKNHLRSFVSHTLKYRKDILNGDFTSW